MVIGPSISSYRLSVRLQVILRVKNSSKKQRPFSTSGLASELAHASPSGGKLAPMQWVSESALQDTLTSSLTDAHGALSSSTVEECTTQTLESSGCSMNSLRRRKLKQRRRSNMVTLRIVSFSNFPLRLKFSNARTCSLKTVSILPKNI